MGPLVLLEAGAKGIQQGRVTAMPMPMEYRQASVDFDRFMEELKEVSILRTSHQSYTMLQAVFQVFRRRLTVHRQSPLQMLCRLFFARFLSSIGIRMKKSENSVPKPR